MELGPNHAGYCHTKMDLRSLHTFLQCARGAGGRDDHGSAQDRLVRNDRRVRRMKKRRTEQDEERGSEAHDG